MPSYKNILPLLIFFSFIACSKKATKEEKTAEPTQQIVALNHQYKNIDFNYNESKKFDIRIERFIRQWELKGVSLAVTRNDSLIYAKGYGYADVENNMPADINNIFRVASVSKLITAVAIMKLREEGKLDLNTKVFGPDAIFNDSAFADIQQDKKLQKITVEHLLRHQGGFSQRAGDPMFDLSLIGKRLGIKPPYSKNDLMTYTLSSKLRYMPGTYAIYSNLGYAILGQIIEKVTGQDYEEYVRENIFKPAGCYNIYLGHNTVKNHHPDEVRYYEPRDHDMIPSLANPDSLVRKSDGGNDVRLLGAAGAWVASPIEIMKFISAIDGRDNECSILSKESVELMTAQYKGGYPIGWMRTNGNNWLRTGNMAGTCAIVYHQQDGYSWAFFSNTSNWKGATFTSIINEMMKQNIKNIKNLPSKESFDIKVIYTE